MEYYTALTREQGLAHGTMGMHPEDGMVSEVNQTQRTKTVGDPTYVRCLERSDPKTHSCQGLGAGRWC